MEIEEGYSFNYFFYSLGLFILGGLLLISKVYIGIFLVGAGIILLFNKTGTYIDSEKKRIGRYNSLFGNKTYKWTAVNNYQSALLTFEFINQKMNSRGTSTTSRTKIYTLYFKTENGKEPFHEYSNYNIAKKVLKEINEAFNFEIIDKFYEAQKSSVNKRKTRG